MALSDWQRVAVEAIKANTPSAIAIGPFGSRMKANLYTDSGVRVIRGNNIGSSRRLEGSFVYVSDVTAADLRSSNVAPDDLVFPHRGAIGEVGIVPDDGHRYMLSTSLMKLSCDTRIAHPLFVFYFFRSPQGRHELLKNSSTVGTPGIATPLASLRHVRLDLPSIVEQRAIAAVLGALDDKIDINRRTGETLEDTARALFKSWFVDFDPVRAKAVRHGRRDGRAVPQRIRRLGTGQGTEGLESGFAR